MTDSLYKLALTSSILYIFLAGRSLSCNFSIQNFPKYGSELFYRRHWKNAKV